MSQENYYDEDITIRKAVKKDMAAVAGMIFELACNLNMPHGPQLSVEDLENDGFEMDPPAFLCTMAENTSDHSSLGYALYFPTYSTWEGRSIMLEDLYVRPGERNRGICKKMFNYVAREAIKLGCSRLDFHLLAWNPACVYYEHRGAVNLTQSEDWLYFRLRLTGGILNELLEK